MTTHSAHAARRISFRAPATLSLYYFGLIVLLYLPIGVLFLFSINANTTLSFPLQGLTLSWYDKLLANEPVLRSARNSLIVALGSSTVATMMATMVALVVMRYNFRSRGVLLALAALPLIVPFVVIGVALLILFSTLHIDRSLWTIGIAHTVVALPYALLIIAARLAERAEWVLGMADLRGRERSLTRTLSGGWKQRLALGCAILHEPPILFLDEPTSGVDPISRRNFWNMIYEMARAGTTVFVTTHYMDEADYCDRLALIYRGKIIAEGTPNELRKNYMTRDVLEIEADHIIDATEILEKQGIETAIFGSLLHATVKDAKAAIPLIFKTLAEQNITVRRVDKIVPSLEDVFVTLIETS